MCRKPFIIVTLNGSACGPDHLSFCSFSSLFFLRLVVLVLTVVHMALLYGANTMDVGRAVLVDREPRTRINFIFMPTQLSDGSCYLHDLIALWPCYCTFQGTQRQNIALDNPRLLSCSHGIYFRLFWPFTVQVTRVTTVHLEFSFLEFMSLVDVWGYRQPTIVLELMGKHALMIYIFATAIYYLSSYMHGFSWKRHENNIVSGSFSNEVFS
ncbi:hypothetical protein IFM89_000538 [Coptis chinensis]|uniref:Uncharacterized protein n=1 Tax=Coptis chinensis TaxID=261450 RepID=A0A835LD07_9MAGN|nr:hypothetical protein IFM89_000538 [Coptis chinensis]